MRICVSRSLSPLGESDAHRHRRGYLLFIMKVERSTACLAVALYGLVTVWPAIYMLYPYPPNSQNNQGASDAQKCSPRPLYATGCAQSHSRETERSFWEETQGDGRMSEGVLVGERLPPPKTA